MTGREKISHMFGWPLNCVSGKLWRSKPKLVSINTFETVGRKSYAEYYTENNLTTIYLFLEPYYSW
jgi:hypothetical protein